MIQRQSRRNISLLAALFLAGLTAFAQQPGGNMQQQQQQQTQQQTTSGQPGAPNSSALGPPSQQSSTPSFVDQAFVEDILQADQAQIQMSQLAQQKTSSADVKDFSQHMIQIHNQLDTQLKPLARQLGVNASPKPSKKEKQEFARLEGLSGTDFDTAYLQAMAKEQQRTLKELRNEAESPSPSIQGIVKADQPALNQNFQILQQIAQTHNVTLEGAKE